MLNQKAMTKLPMTLSLPNLRHPLVFAVMNVTPDSFSDGGLYLKNKTVTETLKTWKSFQSLLPDIGAESTAPMNQSISHESEWERLESFFAHHLETLLSFSALSFDTYKTETIKKILHLLDQHDYSGVIYWNDVSGQYDQEVERLLDQHKNLYWILCHTLVTTRSEAAEHKKFLTEINAQNVFEKMKSWFEQRLNSIPLKLKDRVLLDPCFGFSKDVETNLELCKVLPLLIESMPDTYCWLIGISKKSFLQAQVHKQGVGRERPDFWSEVEREHMSWLTQWLRLPYFNRLSFRVHDPLIMRDALYASSTSFHF